jgi:hypothetical protein
VSFFLKDSFLLFIFVSTILSLLRECMMSLVSTLCLFLDVSKPSLSLECHT